MISTERQHQKPGRPPNHDYHHYHCVRLLVTNKDMSEFYSRLTERGKCHKVALTAVMRKPAVLVNKLLRERRGWEKHAPSASGRPNCAPDLPIRRPAVTAPAS